MQVPAKKEYEKPEAGLHNAILADVVDAGIGTSNFQGQIKQFPQAYFVWILATLGKDGKPLQVRRYYNISSLHEKSNVHKDLKMIIGAPPNPATDLDAYIGVVRKLWINREKSADGTKDLVKIQGYLPYEAGTPTPIIPPDFIREKDKPKTQAGPQGQPVQTYQQPPAQAQQAQQPVYTGPAQGAQVKF